MDGKNTETFENETHTIEIWKTSDKDEVVSRTERSLGSIQL